MDSKPKLLYVTLGNNSFIRKDREILEKKFTVSQFIFDGNKTMFSFLKLIFFLLRNIFATRIICFFAHYHSLLPIIFSKILSKKSLIVIGGTEAYNIPSINYGNYRKRLVRIFTKYSIKWTDYLLPVSESLMLTNYSYDPEVNHKQGLKNLFGDDLPEHKTITLEYPTKLFTYDESIPKKRNTFICVGYNLEGSSYFRKGIDLIFQIASTFPECTFNIVGFNEPEKVENVPSNVKLFKPVNYETLKEFYCEAEFYLQLSMAEGFPSSICEAMLCKCIPIGSDIASIPDIIGDCGYILKSKNIIELEQLIKKAIHERDLLKLGNKSRNRIVEKFGDGKRSEILLPFLESFFNS